VVVVVVVAAVVLVVMLVVVGISRVRGTRLRRDRVSDVVLKRISTT
jgi:hypothetical protein